MSDPGMSTAELVEPSEALREAYLDFLADFARAGEKEIHGAGRESVEDFAAFVCDLREQARGVNVPPGRLPASRFWLVRQGRVLGTCGLRHRLNDYLRNYGGHIGYSVRPAERNKGYGTLMLRLALDKARALGLERVLVTCDKDNVSSARVIQKNGGVLESEGIDPSDAKVIQRYWIELRPAAGSSEEVSQ
jgi:predicted acetyltransferase